MGNWKKQSISLRRENKSEKSEIGTHDISCGDKCVLKVALSTKGDKKFKIDKPQDAYEKLLSNKSSIDDCEVNQSCYLGIYYAFKPMKSNKSLVYYEPKLSYGILEINALNEKRYFYIYIRFLYKGIIIKHNKTEPTYTKTSLFLCEKRRFFYGPD